MEKKVKAPRKAKAVKSQNPDWMVLEKFEMSFEHKVRLYRNLKLELTNSYCASQGTVLKFTKIKNEDNTIVFRVHRNGRRTFFTTSTHLAPPQEA
jgi:phosphoserine phosphatase